MTDPADTARDLMSRIRYQVFLPEVTTMGACSSPYCCTGRARGSGMCADCLAHDLDELIGSCAGTNYVYACEGQRDAERAVLEAAGGDDERG